MLVTTLMYCYHVHYVHMSIRGQFSLYCRIYYSHLLSYIFLEVCILKTRNAGKWQKCKIYFGAWPVARAGEARGRKGARRLLEAADIGWAMEFVAAGGARDGCWKPQILHSLAAKAPGEGTLQRAGDGFCRASSGVAQNGFLERFPRDSRSKKLGGISRLLKHLSRHRFWEHCTATAVSGGETH